MLRQIVVVTALNLRSIGQRLGSSAVAVFGIAGVVLVFMAILSVADGLRSLQAAGDPRTVLALRAGSDTEMTSGFYLEHVRAIAEGPGIAREAGEPLVSPELLVIINVPLQRNGLDAQVPLRGVLPIAFKVHDRLRIVAGRRFIPGRNEVIVGRAAHRQFAGLDVGSIVRSGQTNWRVVGIFDDANAVTEGEIWCDARVAQPAYGRGNSYQSVSVRLTAPDRFEALKDTLTSDRRLTVTVMRQADYYAAQSRDLQRVVRGVGVVITFLMALGAIFAAVNTMYSAVASRTREIATLRALGFGGLPVSLSVLVESILLGVAGAALGGLVAWVALDGVETSTLNLQTYSQLSFRFAVSARLVGEGFLCALIMGLVGGVLPAIRAVRVPVIDALRDL